VTQEERARRKQAVNVNVSFSIEQWEVFRKDLPQALVDTVAKAIKNKTCNKCGDLYDPDCHECQGSGMMDLDRGGSWGGCDCCGCRGAT
jgi:hypothetical protein